MKNTLSSLFQNIFFLLPAILGKWEAAEWVRVKLAKMTVPDFSPLIEALRWRGIFSLATYPGQSFLSCTRIILSESFWLALIAHNFFCKFVYFLHLFGISFEEKNLRSKVRPFTNDPLLQIRTTLAFPLFRSRSSREERTCYGQGQERKGGRGKRREFTYFLQGGAFP